MTAIFRRRRAFTLSLLLVFSILLGAGIPSQAARTTGTVKNPVLNVRSSPSTSSSIVCKLTQGTKVNIIGETTGDDGMKWYDVYFAYGGDAKEGYVRADLVTVAGSTSNAPSSGSSGGSSGGSRYVKPAVALVRSIASTKGDIRSRLGKGTQVSLISSKTGDDGMTWYKVSYTDNGYQLNGYVRSDLLSEGNAGNSGSSSSGIAQTPATVKPAVANIRSIASTNGDIRSKLSQGTQVKILLEKTGDDGWKWYKISYTHQGQALEGYIRFDLLNVGSTSSGSAGSSGSSSSKAVAKVRSIASPFGDIRATLENGTKVTILKEVTGEDGQKWTKIAFTQNGNQLEGYIPSALLK